VFTNYSVGNNECRAITVAAGCHVWAGLWDTGVARLDDQSGSGQWSIFDFNDGLVNQRVYVARAAPGGRIWFGTDAGVSAYVGDARAADITGAGGAPDGAVDAMDYLRMIAQWGSPCAGTCDGDVTGPDGYPDGAIDALDFLALIGQWGPAPECP
jgi:hypothetical protein